MNCTRLPLPFAAPRLRAILFLISLFITMTVSDWEQVYGNSQTTLVDEFPRPG